VDASHAESSRRRASEACAAARIDSPVFIRVISKTLVPELFEKDHDFQFGKGCRLREGDDVALIGTGVMTSRLLETARRLDLAGVRAAVLHLGSISPLDEQMIIEAAQSTGRLVVAEEHYMRGGLGAAVAETVVRHAPVPVLSIGVPNVYAPIGPADWLFDHFGLTGEKLAEQILDWLGRTARVRRTG
jgi:transketolase